ncbi:hypothetical protein ACB094_09G156000 [Castanea mollissima]
MAGISRREAGETSSRITDAHTNIFLSEATTLEEKIKTVMEARKKVTPSPSPKIQKVIFLLRDNKDFFQKHYEPRAVSLGPIHHGKEKYKLGEKYKLVLTYEFVNGSEEKIIEFYKNIEENINELKKCFEEEVIEDYDDEELIWLLLVDGCATLQYIYSAANHKFKDLKIKTDSVALTQQDLFLLENQLPYFLLKWLMNWSKNEFVLKKSIETYIDRHVNVPQPEDQPLILSCAWLSSLSWNWSQESENEKKQRGQSSNCCACLKGKGQQYSETEKEESDQWSISVDKHGDPIHLLDLLRTRLLHKHPQIKPKNPNGEMETCQSYRNVQELRAAGIHVERSKKKSCCLSDISFTTLGFLGLGYLWLPPLVVDDSTRSKFLNLIAYEMCVDFENDFGVTSYISFLDSLIVEPNDVKMLRKAGILHNFLGSDEEVAQLFNEIGTDLVPNNEIYSDVRSKIQRHYRNKWMTWIAQFFHDHFSSPWTFIAFVGALLALVLIVIQTKYAVNPSPGPCDSFCKNSTQT